jgi:hypothetical protein
VSNGVRKTLAEMKSRFPEGIDYIVALDTNDFVKLSIEEVIHTLAEAIVLVVLIVYLFLQSFRTTIICTVAIFVSLITTLAGMLALGFSINLITLFGLGTGDRNRRRRCDRGDRERRAQHARVPPAAEGGDDQGDERNRQLAGRRRAGDGVGVRSSRHSCPAQRGSSTSSSR